MPVPLSRLYWVGIVWVTVLALTKVMQALYINILFSTQDVYVSDGSTIALVILRIIWLRPRLNFFALLGTIIYSL